MDISLVINTHFCKGIISRPGEARGCSKNTSVIHSIIDSVTDPLWKYLYSAATPKWLEMVLSVKWTVLNFSGDSKSRRASKSHYWCRSYGNFAELVDFAYWWSFSGGGSAIKGATLSRFILKKRIQTMPLDREIRTYCYRYGQLTKTITTLIYWKIFSSYISKKCLPSLLENKLRLFAWSP